MKRIDFDKVAYLLLFVFACMMPMGLVCYAFLTLQGVNVITIAICAVMAIAVCVVACSIMMDEIKGI